MGGWQRVRGVKDTIPISPAEVGDDLACDIGFVSWFRPGKDVWMMGDPTVGPFAFLVTRTDRRVDLGLRGWV